MRINNNITALNSHRQYGINSSGLGRNVERLSSGFRINRAADDAAGLAISEGMRTQIRGLRQASRNAQDGISLVQTAEGALQEVHQILQRMRELVVQAASDINTHHDNMNASMTAAAGTNASVGSERAMIQIEIANLADEIADIMARTEFNGQNLFSGGGSFGIQTGANGGQLTQINLIDLQETVLAILDAGDIASGTSSLGLNQAPGLASAIEDGVDRDDIEEISDMLNYLDAAINVVSGSRAELGAIQNRLEHKIANLDNTAENLQAAESRIRDLDMAAGMTEFTRNNIMFQASTAMLAQANALPQSVLQLLG